MGNGERVPEFSDHVAGSGRHERGVTIWAKAIGTEEESEDALAGNTRCAGKTLRGQGWGRSQVSAARAAPSFLSLMA